MLKEDLLKKLEPAIQSELDQTQISEIMVGVKSGLSYNGVWNIEKLWEKAKFVKITHSGFAESHPHNIKLL